MNKITYDTFKEKYIRHFKPMRMYFYSKNMKECYDRCIKRDNFDDCVNNYGYYNKEKLIDELKEELKEECIRVCEYKCKKIDEYYK